VLCVSNCVCYGNINNEGPTTELVCIATKTNKRAIYINIWITECVYNKILVYRDRVLRFYQMG